MEEKSAAVVSGDKQLLSPLTDSNTFPRKADKDLNLYKKVYEFYTAPVTKFWAYSVSLHFKLRFLFSCSRFVDLQTFAVYCLGCADMKLSNKLNYTYVVCNFFV